MRILLSRCSPHPYLSAPSCSEFRRSGPTTDWPAHGRDAGGMRFSPLKQINTANVSQLKVAWTYDTKVAVPDVPQRGAGAGADNAGGSRGPVAPARRGGRGPGRRACLRVAASAA